MSDHANHSIYWALVKDQNKRKHELVIEELPNNKWGVQLDDEEFTIESDSPDFWDLLTLALAERLARLVEPQTP